MNKYTFGSVIVYADTLQEAYEIYNEMRGAY
jgi:hypothetical protein